MTSLAPDAADVIDLGPGLLLRGTRMRFERNAEIFGEAEPADYIYRVVSGAVRTMRFASDGRRQIMAFYLPGDVFGAETGDWHTLSAEAVCPAEITVVRRSLLQRAASQDVRAARRWLELTSNDLRRAHEHALILGRKGAGERVAAFLLQFADRLVQGEELDLPMSRADIADHLGLTIETVSRAFSEMERQSAISLPSSRHVVVRSRPALAQLEAA
jgi:CRP/FNR family nitrogen fixation transcriptional regulator